MAMMLMIGAGVILYVALAIAAGVKIIRNSHKMFMIIEDPLLEEEIKKSKRSKKNG